MIGFSFPVPNHHMERQSTHTPAITHVTHPNLSSFRFRGVSAYLEAVLRRIVTPRLEKFSIQLFKQLTFSVPSLVQFMNTTEILRFDGAHLKFYSDHVHVNFYSYEGANTFFLIYVDCWHLDWQVSSVVQLFDSLGQILSTLEHLTLEHEVHSQSSEEHNGVDRTEWRKLLRSFGNVTTLHVGDGIVKDISRCLKLDDGELPLELLPELQKLTYFGSGDTSNAFTSFIDARQSAGLPVKIGRAHV